MARWPTATRTGTTNRCCAATPGAPRRTRPGTCSPTSGPGMDLLDVGCGPGTITLDLAARVAPGRVVGVDAAADVIEKAEAARAEAGAGTVSFATGDVYALEHDDGSFDVVHAHQVLQHLVEPVRRAAGDAAGAASGRARRGARQRLRRVRLVARRSAARPVAGPVPRAHRAQPGRGRRRPAPRAVGAGGRLRRPHRLQLDVDVRRPPTTASGGAGCGRTGSSSRRSPTRCSSTASPTGRSWATSAPPSGSGPPTPTRRSSCSTARSSPVADGSRHSLGSAPMKKIMDGVRILELAAWTYVPAAGAVLAEWGADVIKIEHPESGDPQRGLVNMGLVPTGPGGINHMIELPEPGQAQRRPRPQDRRGSRDAAARSRRPATSSSPTSCPTCARPCASTSTTSAPPTRTSSTCAAPATAPRARRPARAATTAARSGTATVADIVTKEGEYPAAPPGPAFGDLLGRHDDRRWHLRRALPPRAHRRGARRRPVAALARHVGDGREHPRRRSLRRLQAADGRPHPDVQPAREHVPHQGRPPRHR